MPTYEIKFPTGEVYNVDSPTELTDEQAYAAVQSNLAEPKAPVGRGGVLASFGEQFATGLTSIPGGIAELLGAVGAVEKPEETTAAKFSKGAEQYIQQALGINPNAEPTTAETAGGALGSLASFFVPGLGVAKGAKLLGTGAKAAGLAGRLATGVQAGSLGAVQQQQQMAASGKDITPEQRSAAILSGGAIGLTDLIPLNRFMGPLESILAKVPLSKAGAASEVVEGAVKRALVSATEEGAQEAFSQAAQNLVAQGIYDPSVNITDGLLANAGAGGFAGGTMDVILQLLAGRKAKIRAKTREQIGQNIQSESEEGWRQGVRAEAQDGLDRLRAAAPMGYMRVRRDTILDKDTGDKKDLYHIVGRSPTGMEVTVPNFSTPDAAILAAEQYSKDVGGIAKLVPLTVGEVGQASTLEDVTSEDALSSVETAGEVKPRDATVVEPEAVPATEGLAAAPLVEPGPTADVIPPTTPAKNAPTGRLRAAMESASPIPETPSATAPDATTGLSIGEDQFPRPPKRLTPEEETLLRGSGLSDVDLAAEGLGEPNWFSLPPTPEVVPKTAPVETPQAPQARVAPAPTELTFDLLKSVLPKDEFGSPDVGVLLDAIASARKGKAVPWEQLTKAQQIKVAKKIAPTLFKNGKFSPPQPPAPPVPPEKAPFVPRTSFAFRPAENTAEGRAGAKAFDERMAKIAEEANMAFAPLGLKSVTLKFKDFIRSKTKSGQEVFPQGYVNEAGDMLTLATNIYDPALTVDQNVQKVIEIMNHEVVHVLMNLGVLKPGEVKTLFEAAQRVKYPGNNFTYFDRALWTYGEVYKKEDGSPNMEMVVEEAVAEMFRDWNAGRLQLVGTPKTAFQRVLEFFKRLFRGVKNAKVDDVFRAIKSGEVGGREGTPRTAGETKFSIPARLTGESVKEFRDWFKQSRAVDRKGNPRIYYNGRTRPLREGQFGRGASGALPGASGPFFFSPNPEFANEYAMTNLSKGGDRKPADTGVVYPAYLSVQNPWDYNSPFQVDDVIEHIADRIDAGEVDPKSLYLVNNSQRKDLTLKKLGVYLERGDWDVIELPAVQEAIRDLGHDGFYLVEDGVRNIAVYNPEQAKSIFNQFEEGAANSQKFSILPRAPGDWSAGGTPPSGTDSQNSNGISPYRISQRIPRGAGRERQSLEQDLEISVEAMKLARNAFEHNARTVLNSYGILPRIEGETAEETAQRFVRHFADNLLWLHDQIPAEIRNRSKLWYDGARTITTQMAKEYNLPDTAIAALIAAESPQKDWYQNVSLAKRIADVVIKNRDFQFTDAMMETARRLPAYRRYMETVNLISDGSSIETMEAYLRRRKGNMIAAGQMSDAEFKEAVSMAKALFVRLYDETYNSKDYQVLSPEGQELGPATKKNGQPSKVAWGSFKEIAKGINVLEDPSKENINIRLGQKHKVRNFYNNIISPNAGSDITSDTHAVAAAHLKPLGGGAVEVHHNFGTSKKGFIAAKNSGPFGTQGIYGLIADAYRLAASERGILPREMQSITWEAIRGMYPAEMRRNRRAISLVNDVWNQYGNSQITIDEARNRLLEITNGIKNPTWHRPVNGAYEVDGDTDNPPVVSGNELRAGDNAQQPDGGTAVGGSGEPSPQGTQDRVAPKVKRADEQRISRSKAKAQDIAKQANKPGANIDGLANAANNLVADSIQKLSILPIDAPMPPALQAANDKLFAKDTSPRTLGEKLMDMFGGLGTAADRTKTLDTLRVNFVHKEGQYGKRERGLHLSNAWSKFEQMHAEFSAMAAMDMRNRASHYTVEVMQNGAPVVKMLDVKTGNAVLAGQGGDINSMYLEVDNDPENTPAKIFEILLKSGPNGTSLVKHFRSYATAQVGKKRLAEGKPLPKNMTTQFIADADQLGVMYPQIVDAFNRYQKFNSKLIKAALDSGVIDTAGYNRYLNGMNYFSMYGQFEEEPIVPGTSTALGSKIKVREYTGGSTNKLMADPITAMMYNVAFWNNAILQNIASQKALRVGLDTKLMERLPITVLPNGNKSVQPPDTSRGFVDKIFYTKINGDDVAFATKDPLLAVGLMSSPQANLDGVFKYLGVPTSFLREMVTRDPGFMIANLLRDSVSTWILAGSGAKPQDTFKGLKSALMKSGSYESLRGFAVIGSFDEAQKSPEKFVAGLREKILPAQGADAITAKLKWGWDRLEKLSEASDAATRIAVFEAAKKNGASDFTAAYRALSIMNFSRSGASAGLRIMTKLVPFLNARIQGLDVLYTGVKAGVGAISGAEQTDFERQRGTAVLYRGMGLMAAAMALALINSDDDDYKQLPQYIKDSNILVPVGNGQFISIPKPFEAGLLFMTVPTTMYDLAAGNRSFRSALQLFYGQFSSTFGFNPVPQFALPILENVTNRDFYTGLPLISAGQEKLDPSLQYNSSTSYVSRGIGNALKYTPLGYNFETGRFEGVSPIMVENLITGYGGPIASYISMVLGGATSAFGTDNEGLPVAASNLPVIRRFFIDAQDRQPQAAADAYELYQQVDKVTRTVARLKKMGDFEALKEYRAENIDVLRVGKQVRKMADNLNNIRAQLRRLETDKVMSGQEKLAKMRELRSREVTLTRKIGEINQKLGR